MRNLFDNSALTVYQGNAMLIEIALTDSETGEPVGVANTDYVLFTVVDMNERVVIQKKLTSVGWRWTDWATTMNVSMTVPAT